MEGTGFLHAGGISGKLKVMSMILVGVAKNRHDFLVHETHKSAECVYELS